MHRVRFNNARALHNRLRRVEARQARAAGLHRQAAQFEAVAVFEPAVRGRVDDEGNVLRREHIVDIGRFAGNLVDRIGVYARLHERLARAGRSIEPKLHILHVFKHFADLGLILIADGNDDLAILRQVHARAVEVIDAMGDVGRAMPEALRETSLGGLAATPTGQAITNRLQGRGQ